MSDGVAYEISFSETRHHLVTVPSADIAAALGIEDGPQVGQALTALRGMSLPSTAPAGRLGRLLHYAAAEDYPEVDGVCIGASRPVGQQP